MDTKTNAMTVQDWVFTLPLMQQAVLLSAIRGPDGMRKESKTKHLVRWYRRCILITAFERTVLDDMHAPGGGSFTGPVPFGVQPIKEFFDEIDELPFHFTHHFMNAVQILAFKHPTQQAFWCAVWAKWCKKTHGAETPEEMNLRLSDNEANWRKTE